MSNKSKDGPIAVIDVETTGLFPWRHDRVVEIAAVVLGPDGAIEREFVTLVNPSRDIGPSSIHGLTSADVVGAPAFGEIAGRLVEAIDGAVAIAAHNVRFDRQFLLCEFERIGHDVPEPFSLCTMELAGGGKLGHCCEGYGVTRDADVHHALGDARAAAMLLARLLDDAPGVASDLARRVPIDWPTIDHPQRPCVTRDEARARRAQPPTYLQRLLGSAPAGATVPVAAEGSMMAYAAILDRVLEDRHISDAEGEALIEMATRWGLGPDELRACHRGYLGQLAIAALADGVVSEAEHRDLHVVARLLGQDPQTLDAILSDARSKLAAPTPTVVPAGDTSLGSLAGKRVCFTGELQCSLKGEPITRELASELATAAGLEVADSVTKKLDLLVLADPESQSGKAKKARTYGVRILHEAVFWRSIGVDVD